MKTYSFLRYLADKKYSFFVFLPTAVLVYIVLAGMDVNIKAIVLILLTLGLSLFLAWTIDYFRNKEFWQNQILIREDPLVRWKLSKAASGLHERLALESQESLGLASQQEIEKLSQDCQDYREFVESWVHEIKTPIAAANLILANNPTTTDRRLKSELDRVTQYVDQALYYARVGSVEKDLSVSLNSVEKLVNNAIKSRAHLLIETKTKIEMKDITHEVICDAKWVEFMFTQVIDNAVKYQDPAKDQPCIKFFEKVENPGTPDQVIYVCIEDEGVGIDSCDIGRVFDKGFVGKNGREISREKSSGIGLYLVSSMCKKMNISLSCTSEKEKGTKICFGFSKLDIPSYKNVSLL